MFLMVPKALGQPELSSAAALASQEGMGHWEPTSGLSPLPIAPLHAEAPEAAPKNSEQWTQACPVLPPNSYDDLCVLGWKYPTPGAFLGTRMER